MASYGYHFAVISKYAYFDPAEGIPAYEELGYKNVKFISVENTQAYLLESDLNIIVAVRGTETDDINDIKSDLNFFKTKSKTRGGVHTGFYKDANEISKEVSAYLHAEGRQYKKVWFAGHSLGGAVATLLASRFPTRVAACYTYGCPRVGNKHWATHQKFVSHRFVNNNDIVPCTPSLLLGYRHYGQLHYINYYGKIRKFSLWQRIKDMIRGYLKAFSKYEWFDSVYDHSVELYVRKLRDN